MQRVTLKDTHSLKCDTDQTELLLPIECLENIYNESKQSNQGMSQILITH